MGEHQDISDAIAERVVHFVYANRFFLGVVRDDEEFKLNKIQGESVALLFAHELSQLLLVMYSFDDGHVLGAPIHHIFIRELLEHHLAQDFRDGRLQSWILTRTLGQCQLELLDVCNLFIAVTCDNIQAISLIIQEKELVKPRHLLEIHELLECKAYRVQHHRVK